MKAILITEPSCFDYTTVSDPSCGPEEVVVQTAFCGMCGTDLELLRGGMPKGFARYPVVPGHEWTGVIAEVGSRVKGRRVGDRVSVEGYLPCGQCIRCLAGDKNLCIKQEQIGMTHNGGFAEFVAAPALSCHVVAPHVGLDDALMIEPAATVVRGIERANPKPGGTAAIVGCGPIGLIAARVLALYEPRIILGIDLAPRQSGMAAQAGVTQFTCSQDTEELRALSGVDGWDVVVNCASGSKPLEMALQIVRRGGSVVVIGGAPEAEHLTLPANFLIMHDLDLQAVLGYTTQSWIRTLDLLSSGTLRLGDLITHRVSLHKFRHALTLMESRSEPIGKVAVSLNV